jgi:hypothetical protein
MEIDVLVVAPGALEADILAVGVEEPATPLSGAAAALDDRLHGRLTQLAQAGEIRGEAGSAAPVSRSTARGVSGPASRNIAHSSPACASSTSASAPSSPRRAGS